MTHSRFLRAALVLLAGTTLALPVAHAQSSDSQPATTLPDAAAPTKATDADLLKDFIHYVRIARYDLAAGRGQELIDRALAPDAFVKLVEDAQEVARFQETAVRAMRFPELEPIAAKLYNAFEQGKLSRARNPEEITRNIEMLTGTIQGRLMAQQRLKAAGEYAMPQLLDALVDRQNRARQAEVQRLIVDLGPQAVAPLCAAILAVEPQKQELIANVLGLIPYKASLPYLADLRSTTKSTEVRDAASRAIEKIGGSLGDNADNVAGLYIALAESYYAELAEVTSFPADANQLLWSFNPGVGLSMTAIRTEVFHEAMAMRAAERALVLDNTNQTALALWVAANFSREIDAPAGYVNPSYPATRQDAMYFAVAAGPVVDQRVLGRALDSSDTPLARRALAAVRQTAGGSALWATADNRSPLIESLGYQNRRVQYDAALALAAAQIREPFAGSERVVPILAGAIREAGVKVAAVIAPDTEQYQALRGILEKQGFKVLSFGRSVQDIAGPVSEAPAVDILVATGVTQERLVETVSSVRANTKLSATPVLLLTSAEAYTALRREFERDGTVAVRSSGIAEAQISKSIDDVILSGSGGVIDSAEAATYSAMALAALRDLALVNSEVFKVEDATLPLIGALASAQGNVQLDIAEVLSRINRSEAQQALADAALAATGPAQIALLGKTSDSAKRFGNMLEARHAKRALELAQNADSALATAAAALVGALNVPNADLVPLILGTATKAN